MGALVIGNRGSARTHDSISECDAKMSDAEALHCYVRGRVQGVFFRASTREKAQMLGLTGYARNLPDGRVEVFACGSGRQLAALKEWLSEGPSEAGVSAVDCRPAAVRQFDDFSIE